MAIFADIVGFLQGVSIIGASLTAIYSLDAWRREFRGKRQMEMAEEAYALFHDARNALHDMRNPMGYAGEGSTRMKGEGETPEETEALNGAFVVVERFQKHRELFGRIETLRYRFMAQFGKVAAEPFDELIKVVNEILISARKLATYKNPKYRVPRKPEEEERHWKRVEDAEKVYWEGYPDDPIQPRVDAVVERMEEFCGGVLASERTLFGALNRQRVFTLGKFREWFRGHK